MKKLNYDQTDRFEEDAFTKLLKNHPALKQVSLKKPDQDYPCICKSHMHYIEVVNWWEFIQPEDDRLPLLIVNRAGLWPKSINYQMLFKESQTVALFHCAYLSGAPLGFDVYRLPAGWHYETPFGPIYTQYRIDYLSI